jgi:hypothetical protein
MASVICNIDFPSHCIAPAFIQGVDFKQGGARLNSFSTENVYRPGQMDNIDCMDAFFDGTRAGPALSS